MSRKEWTPGVVRPQYTYHASQFAHVLAAGAKIGTYHLFVHESLEGIGQEDVHYAHGAILDGLAR